LSVISGYVDTAGFLALQGLFTSHVTGNFVTLGAALVFGSQGVVAKLLALPVFCIVVALVRMFGVVLEKHASRHLPVLLALECVLLSIGAVLAVTLGPFTDSDTPAALVTGMTLVAAMAIQNGLQRIHLASAPPTTIMTGNTTQIMIDIVDALRPLPEAQRDPVRARLPKLIVGMTAFVIGCAGGAGIFAWIGVWCFAVPPVLALGAIFLRIENPPAAPTKPAQGHPQIAS
jgi:uncharacterized membrane protein YoaK (UPF0700 family)